MFSNCERLAERRDRRRRLPQGRRRRWSTNWLSFRIAPGGTGFIVLKSTIGFSFLFRRERNHTASLAMLCRPAGPSGHDGFERLHRFRVMQGSGGVAFRGGEPAPCFRAWAGADSLLRKVVQACKPGGASVPSGVESWNGSRSLLRVQHHGFEVGISDVSGHKPREHRARLHWQR
jgi:hypothetical protein